MYNVLCWTLGDAKLPRPVVPIVYHPGKAGIIRQGGKRSVPCSGKVLSPLEIRKGRRMALMPFEQNFGEWMEFRHEKSWPSRNRKSNGEIKCGGRIKLGVERSSHLK